MMVSGEVSAVQWSALLGLAPPKPPYVQIYPDVLHVPSTVQTASDTERSISCTI